MHKYISILSLQDISQLSIIVKRFDCSDKFETICVVCTYTNREANPYQSIFAALYQMSVALSGSSTDVPVHINTSNKIASMDLVRRVQLYRNPMGSL